MKHSPFSVTVRRKPAPLAIEVAIRLVPLIAIVALGCYTYFQGYLVDDLFFELFAVSFLWIAWFTSLFVEMHIKLSLLRWDENGAGISPAPFFFFYI